MSTTSSPPRACVIGWPIGHSRSPIIHGYWLQQFGLAGSYEKVAVEPGTLPAFINRLREGEFVGCSITLPHKQPVLDLVDEALEPARAVGAANTLWLDGARLIATNTDTHGFMAHLDASVPQWQKKDRPVAVIGAGGAARAIVYGMLQRGVGRVRVINRTLQRAEALVAQFGPRVEVVPLERGENSLGDCGLLINSTSLGMDGQPEQPIDIERLPHDATVADIVYVPLETELLAHARARGLATVDGLGMLLHQAVPGFEHWFGRRPAVTAELRARVEADILGVGR